MKLPVVSRNMVFETLVHQTLEEHARRGTVRRIAYLQEGIIGWYEHAGKQHWTASVDLSATGNGALQGLGWFRSRRRAVQAIRRAHLSFVEKTRG